MSVIFTTDINTETKLNVIKLDGGKYRVVLISGSQVFNLMARNHTELCKISYRLSELENNILVGLDDTIG